MQTERPMYELHYSDGGHGGPWTFAAAIGGAVGLVRGTTRSVTIRHGVNGPVAVIVRYCRSCQQATVADPDGHVTARHPD